MNQGQKNVTFGSAMTNFFKGSVDFSGFSSRSEHWFPVGTFYLVFAGIYTAIFSSVYSQYNQIGFFKNMISFSDAVDLYIRYNRDFASLIYIITGVFILLHIPITASFCRRLKDVGFTTVAASILIVLYFILAYFFVPLITPIYVIVFFFVLMSLPTNKLETDSNDDFSKFLFRQTMRAQQYYGQFNNNGQTFYQGQNGGQFNQYGQPTNGQPNFQNGQQQYNQNFQGNNGYPGYNDQNPQGYGQQPFNQYGQPMNPNYQGQPNQGQNPNGPRPQQPNQGQNPNGPRPQQPNQGVNPNGPRPQQPNQGQNPNGPRPQQPNHPGQQNQGVNSNQGQNPNGPRSQQPNHSGQQNQGVNSNQGQNPNGPRPQQPTNQGPVNQGVNPNHQEQSPVKEAPKTQETVEKQEVPTSVVKETVEENKEVNETSSVQGGAKSRRLQKLNKPEEEQTILKRRNK